MDNQNKIEDILGRIAEGKHTDADLNQLRELLSASESESLIQLGKNIVGNIDGQDIQIGDRIYQGVDAEAVKEALRLVLPARSPTRWQYLRFGLLIGGFVCILGGITLFVKQPFNTQQLSFCSLPASKTEADWVRYQDEIEPVEINYPRTWQKQEIKDAIRGQLAVLFPPQTELLYKANLELGVENISSIPNSLDEYLASIAEEIDSYTQDISFQNSCNIALAEHQGYMVIYSGKEKGNKFKRTEVGIYKNNKAYHLTYTAKEEEFTKYLPTVKAVIASFKVRQ
jgi:hypothetical protein